MVFNERFLTPMGLRDSKKRSKFVSRWKNRHFVSSFKYAVEGLVTAYREERNLRFHVGSVILVVIMGCLFHVSANEWLWLLLSIFFVLQARSGIRRLKMPLTSPVNIKASLGKKGQGYRCGRGAFGSRVFNDCRCDCFCAENLAAAVLD